MFFLVNAANFFGTYCYSFSILKIIGVGGRGGLFFRRESFDFGADVNVCWKLRPRTDVGIHFRERRVRTANGDGEKKTKHP